MKRKLMDVLGSMTFKEKVGYIWGYYKIQISITLLLVLTISYTAHAMKRNNEEIYVNVTFLGQFVPEETLVTLREQVSEQLILEEQQGEKKVRIQHIPFGDDNNLTYVAGIQKFFAQVAAEKIDILIADEEIFHEFQEQEAFLPFHDLNGFYTFHLEEGIIKDESTNNTYGIRTNNIEIFNHVAGNDERILSILANSERQEAVLEFLQSFL